jgi:hypothetical protein
MIAAVLPLSLRTLLTKHAAWLVATLLLALLVYVFEGPKEMNDIEVFYKAGGRFITGDRLYQTEDGYFQYKYPPTSAMVFGLLSLLPIGVAKVAWLIMLAVLTAWVFLRCASVLCMSTYYALPAAIIFGRSLEREFANCQVNVIIVFLVLEAVLERKRIWRQGLLVFLAMLIKPYAVLMFPYLLTQKRWRSFVIAAALTLASWVLVILRYGIPSLQSQFREFSGLLAAQTLALADTPVNVSVVGLITKWFGPQTFGLATRISIVLTLVLCALFFRTTWVRQAETARAQLLDVGMLCGIIILASPQAWDYGALVLIPLAIYAAHSWREQRRVWQWLLAVSALVLLPDYYLLLGKHYRAFMSLSLQTLAVAIALVWALWERATMRATMALVTPLSVGTRSDR